MITPHGHRRSNKVSPGGWTLILNLVGKAQSAAVIISGAAAGGLSGVGIIISLISAALLASTCGDFGFSSEINRAAAETEKTLPFARIRLESIARAAIAAALAPTIFAVTTHGRSSLPSWAYLALSVYAFSLVISTVATSYMYGRLRFQAVSVTLGVCRLLSSSGAFALCYLGADPLIILGAFATAEAVGAALLSSMVGSGRRAVIQGASKTSHLNRSFYWLGCASVVNVLSNQSDVLIVSHSLSPAAVGVFGIASQLQNGVSTLAVSFAAPVTSLVAKHQPHIEKVADIVRTSIRTTRAFCLFGIATVCIGLVAMHTMSMFTAVLSRPIFFASLVIGLLSAVPSVESFVYLSALVGLGRHRVAGFTRAYSGIAAVAVIYIGGLFGGLLGASIGTILRDVILVVFSRRAFQLCLKRAN